MACSPANGPEQVESSPTAARAEKADMTRNDPLEGTPEDATPTATRGVNLPFFCWAGAVLAVAGTAIDHHVYKPVFESLEVDLPPLAAFIFELGDLLVSPIGWISLASVLFAGYLPILLGARGPRSRRYYRNAAIATFVLAALTIFAVRLPITKLQEKLAEDPPVGLHG